VLKQDHRHANYGRPVVLRPTTTILFCCLCFFPFLFFSFFAA